MNNSMRIALAVAGAALFLAGPSFLSSHMLLLIALIATTSIITAGLSIVTGVAGQVTMAQAAFCAFGAYGATLLTFHTGVPMWLTIPVATLLTAAIGYGLGVLSLRVEGHYLALVTLAFAGIVNLGLIHLTSITGGAVGRPAEKLTLFGFTFGSPTSLYYLSVLPLRSPWSWSPTSSPHVGGAHSTPYARARLQLAVSAWTCAA